MNIQEMLKKTSCECGREHSCAIEDIIIGCGVINRLQDTVKAYSAILLVADKNTYSVCGKNTEEILDGKLAGKVVFDREGLLIPNEDAVYEVEAEITEKTDLIIGVGSGVIQDICKYVSFKHSLPYQIVATAPSMDGYASVGAAMIMNNMKITYAAHVPQIIIADTDILKNAPMEMIQSGYGDIIGKLSCLNDWKLSAEINGEYFCQHIYDMVMEMTNAIKDDGELLLKRDTAAIERLTEALMGVGIAMANVGNSRPASGSEHHLSHFFEIVGILNDEPYFMHGTDVAYSTVLTCLMREEIINFEGTLPEYSFSRNEWCNKIKEVYTNAAEGVIALQDKVGFYNIDAKGIYEEKWDKILSILQASPKAEEIIKYLRSVGLDFSECEKMYSHKKLEDAKWFAKDLKDRYTVLWIYYYLYYGE